LRRDDVRSDPSHKLLRIINVVCRQRETSHEEKTKVILACISSSYFLNI
jgi:hypothetical protein